MENIADQIKGKQAKKQKKTKENRKYRIIEVRLRKCCWKQECCSDCGVCPLNCWRSAGSFCSPPLVTDCCCRWKPKCDFDETSTCRRRFLRRPVHRNWAKLSVTRTLRRNVVPSPRIPPLHFPALRIVWSRLLCILSNVERTEI